MSSEVAVLRDEITQLKAELVAAAAAQNFERCIEINSLIKVCFVLRFAVFESKIDYFSVFCSISLFLF